MTNNDLVRLEALRMALNYAADMSTEEVVVRAEKFEAFLRGVDKAKSRK